MCLRLRKEGDQQHHISNKLRELARLVLETKKYCEDVKCLRDCLIPKNFDFVVEAATELSGWNEEEGCMSTPSIGIKLGHSLKKCAKILKGEGIRLGSKTLKNQADDLTALVELSWNDEISRVARTELERRHWNAPKLLPLTSDLQALKAHLKQVFTSAIVALGINNSDQAEYRNLATATLSSLILFNRRRAGEPALMKISDFEQKLCSSADINDEVKESLSPFERKLCNSFKRLELRGKRGRRVPLLLTKEMEKGINLLLTLRKEVGVNPENPFVFPVLGNGSIKNIRGPDAIRKHVRLANLKNPEAIYSTNLRKHIATLSQLINLEKNELEMLATFLGHNIDVHKQYYRLTDNTLQLAKCSKLMLLMENGGVGKQHGKSLDEIEVDLDEAATESESTTSNDSTQPQDKPNNQGALLTDASDSDEDDEPVAKRKKNQPKNTRDNVTGRRMWSDGDKKIIHEQLDKFFRNGKVPGKAAIDPVLQEFKMDRTWRDVKNYVHNYHNSQKNKLKRKFK